MNKKVAIAVGSAAAVAFTGVAFASDIYTINNTEDYTDPAVAAQFVAAMPVEDCGATAGGGLAGAGNCSGHGGDAVLFMATGQYFSNGVMVPAVNTGAESGYLLGLDMSGGWFDGAGGSLWTGLNLAWTNATDAVNNHDVPMGVVAMMPMHQSHRDFWVDQTVVTYVEAWASLGGTDHYAQNFRSQLAWQGTDLATAQALIDQRLEQYVELSGPGSATTAYGEAGAQTLQQAIQILSGPNSTANPDFAPGSVNGERLAQLVAQDVEGFFESCVNCDSPELLAADASHAWTVVTPDITFIPYKSQWNTVPTVQHADNGAIAGP